MANCMGHCGGDGGICRCYFCATGVTVDPNRPRHTIMQARRGVQAAGNLQRDW
ncbi:MAG: hypothetical protein R2911_04280 [Caldilineaceae bacterium]